MPIKTSTALKRKMSASSADSSLNDHDVTYMMNIDHKLERKLFFFGTELSQKYSSAACPSGLEHLYEESMNSMKNIDLDITKSVLKIKQAVLGPGAVVGERNIVEVEATSVEGLISKHPIVSLTLGQNDMTCVDLEFDLKEPVTFHLSEGSGPVFLTGMHDVLSYWEDDLSLFSDSEVINECETVENEKETTEQEMVTEAEAGQRKRKRGQPTSGVKKQRRQTDEEEDELNDDSGDKEGQEEEAETADGSEDESVNSFDSSEVSGNSSNEQDEHSDDEAEEHSTKKKTKIIKVVNRRKPAIGGGKSPGRMVLLKIKAKRQLKRLQKQGIDQPSY